MDFAWEYDKELVYGLCLGIRQGVCGLCLGMDSKMMSRFEIFKVDDLRSNSPEGLAKFKLKNSLFSDQHISAGNRIFFHSKELSLLWSSILDIIQLNLILMFNFIVLLTLWIVV